MPPPRVSGIRLDALIQQVREPVFWLGPDRRIVLVNRAWEELTGHPAREVVGLECHPHGPTRPGDPTGLGGSFCPPPEALAGRAAGGPTLILHPGGDRLWRRVEFWPFHDTEGALTGLLGLVRPLDEPAVAPDSEAQRLRVELLELRDQLQSRHGFDSLIGHGAEHRRLLDQVATAAATTVPILIVGEAGTGKRMLARTIHNRGPRRQAPLLAYDCQALPPEILERELFGTPFSSAPTTAGLVAPEGATVVLGDLLDLPRDLQAKLAAGLDGRSRLIGTTVGDPDAALRDERLRPDLYYAMTALVLRLRPLRDRLADLPLFAQHFLERANLRGDRRRDGFEPEALAALAAYDWPGNLRELARVVDDAHARRDGNMIGLADIPATVRGERGGAYVPRAAPTEPIHLKDMLTQFERRLIERALERSRQNKSRAAKLLGINRPLLYRRIKELGILDLPEPDASPTTDPA